MRVPLCKPVSDPVIFAVYSVQLPSAGKITYKRINLVLLGFAVHLRRNSLVEDLVGPGNFVLKLLTRQFVYGFFVLPLGFDVLYG